MFLLRYPLKFSYRLFRTLLFFSVTSTLIIACSKQETGIHNDVKGEEYSYALAPAQVLALITSTDLNLNRLNDRLIMHASFLFFSTLRLAVVKQKRLL